MGKKFTTLIPSAFLLASTHFAASAGAVEEALAAWWDFGEGAGTVLHDQSGNGNNGTIHGAIWVERGKGYALKFDGKDDYVDCGAGPSLDLTEALSVELWFRPAALPPGIEPGLAGKGIGPYGLTYYGGACWWYLRPALSDMRAHAPPDIWHHVVGTFDGSTARLYVDGKTRAAATCAPGTKLNKAKNFYIGGGFGWTPLADVAGVCSFKGMIDEVRVYRRALSTEEVRRRYAQMGPAFGFDLTVKPLVSHFAGKVFALLEFRGAEFMTERVIAAVEMARKEDPKAMQTERVEFAPRSTTAEAVIDAAGLKPGEYELRATVTDASGKRIAGATPFTWPEKPSLPGAKILNNMVAELLNVRRARRGEQTYEFVNSGDGWVFFSSSAQTKDGEISVWLEPDPVEGRPVLLHDAGQRGTLEAMRFLRAGSYGLRVRAAGNGSIERLVVRAVPEIGYCFLPAEPLVKEFGPYDRAFLAKDILPNVNCMISESYSWFPKTPEFQAFVRQWRQSGRKWIVRCGGIPGIHVVKKGELTAEKAFSFWASDGSWKDPLLDGIIVDEFSGGADPRFPIWAEAVRRLHAAFPGRTFYPWCGRLYSGEPGRAFMAELIKSGDLFAWEVYLKEQPSQAAAWLFLETRLVQEMLGWREVPGAERHVMVCFGHLMSAPPETLSADPAVDFKVYVDMQFNLLANNPAFWNLGGVMEYHAAFADEESIRWAGKLFRHYCIEGKTEMLSKDYGYRYNPDHIQNADFDQRTEGWTLSLAEPESITVGEFPGLGWMEGRFQRGVEGDHFLRLKRNAKSPNVFSQTLRNLEPGRLYSVRMFTGDYQDLSQSISAEKKHAVAVRIANADVLPELSFQCVFKQRCTAHQIGKFTPSKPAWMNFHRKVFRAKASTATLIISDWAGPDAPGGPIGQELMFNFIEVQPYLTD